MGFQATWIARAGNSTEELVSVSRRVPTGERVEHPGTGFYLVELPSDNETEQPWVVLVAYGTEFLEDLDDDEARALSENGSRTLRFVTSDSVMATKLACFENGSEVWSVDYDCEDESTPILAGDGPPIAQEILDRLVAKQDSDPEVDFIYELTAELGSQLIGFRHDEGPRNPDPEPFQVLRFENEIRQSESQSTEPPSPKGPLDELFRKLILSGTLHGMPVKKESDRIMIGSPEFGVEAVEAEGGLGLGPIRLTFFQKGKTSNSRGSVERCAKKIDSFCSPAARHRNRS